MDTEAIEFSGSRLTRGELGYVGTGVEQLTVTNPTEIAARAILLGGKPFGEQIVMWWNFPRLPAPPLPRVRMVPRRNAPTANPGNATP